MKVKKIVLNNFMVPGGAILELPETGVTVLTGDNGAGKSRFVEAVAFAHWGRTMRQESERGYSPWIDGLPGHIRVETEFGACERRVTARGSRTVAFEGLVADTIPKTQELINTTVGEMPFWQRTRVFSSADALLFSRATDGERKRLLEMVLHLEIFDQALDRCCTELGLRENERAAVSAQEAQLHTSIRSVNEIITILDSQIPALAEYPAPATQPQPVPNVLIELGNQRRQVQDTQDSLREAMAALAVAPSLKEAETEIRAESVRLKMRADLAHAGKCDQCGSEFTKAHAKGLYEQYHECLSRLDEIRVQIARAQEAVEQHRLELKLQIQSLTVQESGLVEQTREAQRVEDGWARYQKDLANHAEMQAQAKQRWDKAVEAYRNRRMSETNKLNGLRFDLDEIQDSGARLEREVGHLRAAKKILGVRGLRAHVLGVALEGIEHVANHWMRKIAPGHSLQLKLDGDRVSLQAGAFGGGYYVGASGGERRRIDAPLLLALAEIAGAAQGLSRGTLWFDEVFDALDGVGRARVAEALGELGQRQSVVVITHMPDLADLVPGAARWYLDAGSLQRMS